MNTTTTSTSRKPWLIAVIPALVLAVGVGAVAARVRTDAPDDITFAVFAALTFPFILALGVVVMDRTPQPEQHADSIESQWTTRASSGAFYDTIVAMAAATFVTSVLDTDAVPVWAFILLGLADMSIRLALLAHREG